MAQIDILTRPQRIMLDDVRDNHSTQGNKSTREVLLRYGFITQTDEGLRLTETGLALYEEETLRANRAEMFTVGETVDFCEWRGNGEDKPYRVIWEPVKVLAIGKSRVKIQLYEDDERGTWRELAFDATRIELLPVENETAAFAAAR